MVLCSSCKMDSSQAEIERIDDNLICHSCLFQGNRPYGIYPIGFIENNLSLSENLHMEGDREQISKVVLLQSQKPFLYKLEEESHIVVVFYFHIQRPIRSKFNRSLDQKEVGVFASRTPDRLSRIGITEVELIKIDGTTLYVKGLYAVNESPVLDIKLGGLSLKN
ncbi:MAG: tRNA (N6-threonylcarbamoyladenosine(37)-N6)-methyltransferase TrmO [Promethearchaeota archaeon]|nr:MAG: tRNA (N6-threonylcarbamoyladenosine(37)-N6)-methyltransferase TrmO [Candidatus Lokiarchaeota archaeon]